MDECQRCGQPFSSPHADALDQIGDLTAIMVLGRLGLLLGPLVGAIAFLLLGEGLLRLSNIPT